MSKYQPLWEYISENGALEVTFLQIKNVLGFEIDHSFLSYKRELEIFGYKVKKISMKEQKIFIEKTQI